MLRSALFVFSLSIFLALSAFSASAQSQGALSPEEIAWGKEKDGLRAGLALEPRILKIGGAAEAIFVLINDSKEPKAVPKPTSGLIDWMFTDSGDKLTASMRSAEEKSGSKKTLTLKPGQSVRTSENLIITQEHLPEGSRRIRVKALFSALELSSGTVDVLVSD